MSKLRAFTMPKWGIEMTEGTIAEWMVKEGEAFAKGQVLCLIETSKITNEVEAEFDAVIHRILVAAGSEAEPVGALLAVFGDADASAADIDAFVASFRPAGDAGKAAPAATPASTPAPPAPAPPAPIKRIETNRPISPEALKYAQDHGVELDDLEGSGRNGRITLQDVTQASRPATTPVLGGPLALPVEPAKVFASPLAVRIAAQHGIDLHSITGSGARGRICKADVLALVKPAAAPLSLPTGATFVPVDNPPTAVPMDKIRKIVAQRLTAAKQTIPHFYLRMQVKVDALLALRKTANLVLASKASINDYLVRAAAVALERHPDVNIQVHGDVIHRFAHADIAVAVASPNGLVTPIVRQANRMRVDQIAAETRRLIDKAQAGKLGYQDMDGGTFSISNLGMFGIDQFDAIINPPQGAILAIGGITRQMAEGTNGQPVFESRMSLSLSCDHRAIDGALGAQFMATLREVIEAPETLFAG